MYKTLLFFTLLSLLALTLVQAQSVTPSRTTRPSLTSTASITSTRSLSSSVGASQSASISITPTVTVTPTATITPTPSQSFSSPSNTASVSATVSVTPSVTSSVSVTPSGSGSNSNTPSISPSISITPSISATPSTSATTSRSISPSPSASFIPIANNSFSCEYCQRNSTTRFTTASARAFAAASALGLVSSSPSASGSISNTPSITPSISTTPSITPSISTTPSITPSISTTPSVTPSSSPSSSASSSPSSSPSESGSNSITPSVSGTISITPSISPSPLAVNVSIISNDTICGTGSFQASGSILTLVNSQTNQIGSAYFQRTYNLTDGFLIQFDARLSNNTANDTTNGSATAFQYNRPGDGFSFVAQQDARQCESVGDSGSGIGYSGILNAIAVEFDVYYNEFTADPSSNHIAVQASPSRGDPVEAYHNGGSALALVDLSNSTLSLYPANPYPFDVTKTIRITYDGLSNELEVSLNSVSVIVLNTTKVNELGLDNALLGFTASTGGSWETVQISNFFATVPYRRPTPSASPSRSPLAVL